MNTFKAVARRRRRIFSLLLLSLLMLSMSGVHPARADGVVSTIGNGQIMYGHISAYTKIDTYTFSAPANGYIMVSIGEFGAHDTNFFPDVFLYKPGGGLYTDSGGYYNTWIHAWTTTNSGTWSVNVSRDDAYMTGGDYEVQVYVVPGAISQSGDGGMMYPSTTYGGTITRGDTGVFTFNGVAGSNYKETLTATGGAGFAPYMQILKPDGSNSGAVGTGSTAYINQPAVDGTFTVLTISDYAGWSGTGTYTLNLTQAGAGMPQNGKQDGECVPCQKMSMAAASAPVSANGSAAAGDPINIATGNLFELVTDYTTVGTNPLALTRTYNSLSYTRNGYATLMGPNWRTNYDRYLRVVSSTQLAAERPDGQMVNFALSGGVGTPDSDVDIKLTYSGSTYTLTDSDDTVETYTVTSGKGVLSSIALPNGYTQTMNYTSSVLTSVSDSYSRSLSFTYTSGVLTGVTTPDSATLTYGYTTTAGKSLLTSVTYNTSPSTSQTYVYANTHLPFMLTSITDENGNTNSQWTYDGSGRCTMSEHAGGADKVQVSYDDSTGNRTVTGPLGNAETYKFTTSQGVPKVTEIDRAANSPVAAASRYFTYDANGYLATATDWDGNSTHWTNNSHGRPTSITEAYGAGVARTTTISYDSTWAHRPYTITKTGVTIDDRYDATYGNLLTRKLTDTTSTSTPYSTNGQTRTWTYTYNSTGELLTAQLPRTDVTAKTTYTYTSGALTSITDALSNVTTVNTYTGGGLPTKITDANSVETDYAYDNRNRLTSKTVVKSGGNEVTGYTYIGSGQPYVITLPDSGSDTLTYSYDNAQRLTKITNGASETINYTLDALGDTTAKTYKNSGGTVTMTHTATFDVLGHMLTSVGATAGESTSFAWDGQNNRTSLTDANSKTTGTTWDALNRASTVTDPLTHTASPTYDALDNITAQTDFNGYSTSYVFDGFPDAAIQQGSPDTGTAVYYYDKDGNQTKRTDARSVETDRTFDALERITAETFPSYSSENIAYTYDDTTGGNKGIGRLTKVTDESGSTTFVFNEFGNVTSSVQVIGTQTYTTSYSYDLANRLTEIIYPSGRYVDYTYDTHGYLTTVTTKPSSGGTVTTLASSIVHNPFGPIASFTYGNTLAQTRSYDENYWLSGIVTSNGSTHIQNLSFGDDNTGNLLTVTDSLDSSRNQSLGVDSLNRLHTASGIYGSRTYTYDNNSNRSTWFDGTTTRTSSYTGSTNLLSSVTDGTNTRHFTCTASGNMASDDRVMNGAVAVATTYGGRDRLESMTVGTPTITFKINARGERVEKATTSTTTDYHYDLAHHLIGESNDSTGADIVEYVWMEGMPLAQIDSSGNITYIHSDQVNAPQKMTDASMTIVWDREQEPFGETYATPTNTTPTNLRFPGQYADVEDLLSYNLMRDYDATLGRYPEADPSGFGGGLNLFSYVGSNPASLVDPKGLMDTPVEPGLFPGEGAGTGAGESAGEAVTPKPTIPTTTDAITATPVPDSAADATTGDQCPTCADPGDCTVEQHRDLQDKVDSACDSALRCYEDDSPAVLNQKVDQHLACIAEQRNINDTCYRGGDPIHNQLIQNRVNAIARCQNYLSSPGTAGLGGI